MREKLTDEQRLEKKREMARRWRAANPERARELTRRWRAANPERVKQHSRNAYPAVARRRKAERDRFRAIKARRKAERAKRILAAVEAGATYSEIGLSENIGPARVCQIVKEERERGRQGPS